MNIPALFGYLTSHPQPEVVVIKSAGPLVFLVAVDAHDLPVRIQRAQHPALEPSEDLAALDILVLEALLPRVQLRLRPDAPRDGIPALLPRCVIGVQSELDQDPRVIVGPLEHVGEKLAVLVVVVPFRDAFHSQEVVVEGECLVKVVDWELEVVDAPD